jgi:dihydroxyacetone kinase
MDTSRNVVDLSLRNALELIEAHADELGALDAAAGDGDHGTTMVRGLRAANDAIGDLPADVAAGQTLVVGGSAFADAAGGASGALFGMFMMSMGQQLASGPTDAAAVYRAVAQASATAAKMGKAGIGDKTFVDTVTPFVTALGEAVDQGLDLAEAWRQALPAAEEGMASTAGMIARKGRASRLGERSREGLDPGAVSMYYLLLAAGAALEESFPDIAVD